MTLLLTHSLSFEGLAFNSGLTRRSAWQLLCLLLSNLMYVCCVVIELYKEHIHYWIILHVLITLVGSFGNYVVLCAMYTFVKPYYLFLWLISIISILSWYVSRLMSAYIVFYYLSTEILNPCIDLGIACCSPFLTLSRQLLQAYPAAAREGGHDERCTLTPSRPQVHGLSSNKSPHVSDREPYP